MLILSSEWEFSPFADPSVITGLENYVFVGLPVSEAANSLVVPLAGHELGHSVWREREVARELRDAMQRGLVRQFSSSLPELMQKVDDDPPSDLHEGVRERWWGLFAWGALERVSEEIFCDFMGVRIFGDAYLCAFMYLVSPHIGVTDRESYPSLEARARYMSYARRRLGVRTLKLQVPKAYSHWFSEPEEDEEDDQDRLTYTEAERFLLRETHKVARSLLPEILDLVQRECHRAKLPVPDARHSEDVYRRLRARVPAEGVRKRGVADIINGGWMAFLDPELWRGNDRKFENINQIVFKSLEVMEFEERTDASKGRRTRKANSPPLARP